MPLSWSGMGVRATYGYHGLSFGLQVIPNMYCLRQRSPNSIAGPYKSGTEVTITATFSEEIGVKPISQISISGTNILAATDITRTGTIVYSYASILCLGNGTATIGMRTGMDLAGFVLTSAQMSGATFTVDNIALTTSNRAPSASATRSGPITYTVTYMDKKYNTSTVDVGDITVNKTGDATGSVGIAGLSLTRTVTISSITDNGSLGISIADDTASDSVGNLAPAADQTQP